MLHVAAPAELHYRRLSEVFEKVFQALMVHAERVLGWNGGKPAQAEYYLLPPGEEPEDEIHERQMGLFLPWMLFNWRPGSGARLRERGPTIAEIYLEEKGHLEELERKLIEAVNGVPYTFYEVSGVEPGKRVHFQEVFTESGISVEERSGSRQLKPADLVFGRAVMVDGVGMIIGLSAYPIPPRYKPGLIELRRSMKKRGPVTFEVLEKRETEIRRAYLEIDRALFTRPQLCNTDGDPIELHKMVFEIDSAEEAFEKLASLGVTETAEELLRSAVKGPDAGILRAEIFWTRTGSKTAGGMDSTLLGSILVEPRRLTVTVNSAVRAGIIRQQIESRLGEKARFRPDEIQDGRALMEEAGRRSAGPKGPKKNPLMQNPEIRRRMAEMIMQQWERWADEKIPALRGRTPRRAVRTKDGREAVEALLADAEKRSPDPDMDAANLKGIRPAREILGLTGDHSPGE